MNGHIEYTNKTINEFSSCDAYGRPNDGPGVTVAVCDPDALRDSIDEGDSTPTVVWDGTSGDIQSRQPLLVTDATDGVPIVFHPQRDSNVLRIYVARTGADGTVQEGWFDGIEAPKGDPLTVDMSGAVWTVTDKTGRVVARYRGGAPVVHKRRAHRALRLLKLRREGKRLRAQFSFTASRRHARVLIEIRRGRRWAVIATRHVPRGRSVGSVRFTPPGAARTARIVLHAGRRVEASRPFRLASR